MLIAGERRWRAARLAGLAEIPAIMKESSPADRPRSPDREHPAGGPEPDRDGRGVPAPRARVQADAGRYLGARGQAAGDGGELSAGPLLPPEIKQEMASGQVSMGHAKAILSLDKKADQLLLLRAIIRRGLSVREAEETARRMGKAKPAGARPPVRKAGDVHVSQLEDRLRRALGRRCGFNRGARGNDRDHVRFAEQLDRLVELLLAG